MTFHRCSQTQPPPQLPSALIITSAILIQVIRYANTITHCYRKKEMNESNFELPIAAVARRSLVRIIEIVATHYASKTVVLSQSVGYGLLVLTRSFVRDNATYYYYLEEFSFEKGGVKSFHLKCDSIYRLLHGHVGCRDCRQR